MPIDATPGGPNANSYVTVADADEYFSTRLDAEGWTGDAVTPERKESALVTAAVRLDQEDFRGRKTDPDQALEWPRTGVRDRDGRVISSMVVPVEIQRAQMELALALLSGGGPADSGLEAFESVSIGPISVKTRNRSAGALPAHVLRFIRAYRSGSASQFVIERG